MDVEPRGFKPLDPGRVNTMDPVEKRFWCHELHCTEAELDRAVNKVGDHVAELRPELETHRRHG